MLLGKVGNKSIAFINHKPFHPGNLQNLERVWLAEQRAAENEKKQKEMLERRKHEVQIEELRKALRNKERQQVEECEKMCVKYHSGSSTLTAGLRRQTTLDSSDGSGGLYYPQGVKKSSRRYPDEEGQGRRKRSRRVDDQTPFKVMSKYKEDIVRYGHTQVWGSFYDVSEGVWGYGCCSSTDKMSTCLKEKSVSSSISVSLSS